MSEKKTKKKTSRKKKVARKDNGKIATSENRKLSDAQLEQLKKHYLLQKDYEYQIRVANIEGEKARMKLDNLQLKSENLNLKKEKALYNHRELLRKISKELGLKEEKFGFDPITGEIKE